VCVCERESVCVYVYVYIQNVPGGKFNILRDHSIGHSKQKNNVHMYMCSIPNGFRDIAISLYSSKIC
jgi:hypothetical protein